MIYCVVPRELAGKLHDSLRRHFRTDPDIDVIVERRLRARRGPEDRRAGGWMRPTNAGGDAATADKRRRVRNPDGRRISDRRAPMVPVDLQWEPPRRLRKDASQLAFYERLAPTAEQDEDAEVSRTVTRIQAGENEAFSELYLLYFDRVYGYLRVLLRDHEEAEDGTQQVFAQVYEAIGRYERRGQPFRAYLFTAVRNYALGHLKKQQRVSPASPEDVARAREQNGDHELGLPALDWISDRELLLFVERLPVAQRQVLLLRFMLDLTDVQIGEILDRSREDVRALQHRALTFLRARLAAIGREPSQQRRSRMARCGNQAYVLRMRRFSLH